VLRFDANASFAHAQFVANHGNGNAVALAPRVMGQGGVTVVDGTRFVSLRARGIADRPGNASGSLTAPGYVIVDVVAGMRPLKKLSIDVTINNLFNSDWREAQFAQTSAVTPASAPVEQMHFTPGIPLTATVTAAYQL
jgi:outer membrane receptor protein involved in Fe transport